jgi:hypothetical protein
VKSKKLKSARLIESTLIFAIPLLFTACQNNEKSNLKVNESVPTSETTSTNPESTNDNNSQKANDSSSKIADEESVTFSITKNTEIPKNNTNTSVFLSQLNKYTIKINLPLGLLEGSKIYRQWDTELPEEIVANRTLTSDTEQIITDEISYKVASLKPQNLNYFIERKGEVLATAKFHIKADLIITNNQTAEQVGLHPGKHNLGILYFDYRSQLNTQGQEFDISADELIANESVIASFSEEESNTPAPEGIAGKNGGSIKITAINAKGTLTVHSRGTRGGIGHAGQEQFPVTAPGMNGRDEIVHLEKNCEPQYLSAKVPAIKFPITKKSPVKIRRVGACHIESYCSVNSTAGQQGPQGLKGLQGSQGLPGGDSGSFVLEIKDNENFYVTTDTNPGLGGPGGIGGPGGQGGPGGSPGNHAKCAPESDGKGKVGETGAPGDSGPPGSSGKTEVSSIKK